jgi:hypothetical protein
MNGSSGNRTRVLGFEAQEDILYPMDPPILFVIQGDNHSGFDRSFSPLFSPRVSFSPALAGTSNFPLAGTTFMR